MVPCIDMANHAAGSNTTALYEADKEGNAVLLLRDGVVAKKGKEVTITYGDYKGACEMLFSYGFVDRAVLHEENAKEMFLELEMMEDDPLALAKRRVSNAAPGVKITCNGGKVEWFSEFVYLIIVNEEDGLEFEVLQTTDASRELQVSWKGNTLSDLSTLPSLLEEEDLWPVFQLRAAAIIQSRVERQLQSMLRFGEELKNMEFGSGMGIRAQPREMSFMLFMLEKETCYMASKALTKEVKTLSENEMVKNYIAEMNGEEVDLS